LGNMSVKAPVMNYARYRKMRKLLHECCNLDNGCCLILDSVCAQSISYTLLCNWFREALLPLDKELADNLLHKSALKSCIICGKRFLPNSNRAKYCPICSVLERRCREAARQRRRYANIQHSTHLEM